MSSREGLRSWIGAGTSAGCALGCLVAALSVSLGTASAKAQKHHKRVSEPSFWDIDPLSSDPSYVGMDKEFRLVARRLHYKPTVVTMSAVSDSQNIADINEAITAGAKAIMYTDEDPAATRAAIQRAKRHGVVMITVGAPDKLSTYSTSTNTISFAKQAVNTIARAAGRNARVVIFDTNLQVPNQAIQYHTFIAYAKKHYPGMKVVAQESDEAVPATAATDVRSVLEANPNANAFWMIESASGPILGRALQQAGKKPGQVFVLGENMLKGVAPEVRAGWIPEVLNECWFSSMPFDAELALAKLAGHGPKKQQFNTKLQLVTKRNLPYHGCPASLFPRVPGEPSLEKVMKGRETE